MSQPTQDTELEEAPAELDRRCPHCGGEPADVEHNLSALGYHHDDQRMHCSECGKAYTSGVPLGVPEPDYYEDLFCPSCGGVGLVHRVKPGNEVIGLHLKCPNAAGYCGDCGDPISPLAAEYREEDGETVVVCPSCGRRHRREDLRGCYHFWNTSRLVSRDGGIALIGYPQITGHIDASRPYGTVNGRIHPSQEG